MPDPHIVVDVRNTEIFRRAVQLLRDVLHTATGVGWGALGDVERFLAEIDADSRRSATPARSEAAGGSEADHTITVRRDGNLFCALCGPNLQEGIAGFGPTISDALHALADVWFTREPAPPEPPGGEGVQCEYLMGYAGSRQLTCGNLAMYRYEAEGGGYMYLCTPHGERHAAYAERWENGAWRAPAGDDRG